MVKLRALYEVHQKEIVDKNVQLKKLASQIECLLKVLEEDNEAKNVADVKINELKEKLR